MGMQKPIHWKNNETRLNAQNMNTIGNSIDYIGQELYGDNYDNTGLVNTVSVHDGWFLGQTGDHATENSGIFKQLVQIGQAVLSPNFTCVNGSKVWASNTYNYSNVIAKHPTSLPDTKSIKSWGTYTDNEVQYQGLEIKLHEDDGKKRSLLGPTENGKFRKSYVDSLADSIVWNTKRIIQIGNVYRTDGIKNANASYTMSIRTGPFLSVDNNTLRIGQYTPYTRIGNAVNGVETFSVNSVDGVTAIGSLNVKGTSLFNSSINIQDNEGNYIQGDTPSSVVVLGDVTSVDQINDLTINTLSGERIQRESVDNAIKLAIIAEVEARINNDIAITEDYKQADIELQERIIGNADDTIDDDTLNGVINYANKEISSINNSLNFFAEEPTTTNPSASMSISVSSIEVGSTFNQVKVNSITFNPGVYTYGSVVMADSDTPLTDGDGYYTYKNGTGLTASSYTYVCSGKIDNSTTTDISLTVSDKTLTSTDYVMLDNDKLIVSCDVSHNAGDLPVDSIGRITESKRITAGTLSLSKTITTYRKPFWGYKLTADALTDATKITSTEVRNLQNNGTSASSLPTNYTVPLNTKQVFFAAKKGVKNNLVIKNVTKEPATSVACTRITDIQVADARGGTNNTTAYDVWYVDLDKAFTTQTKLQLTWS